MKNGFKAKTSGETVGVVTPTSRLPCAKCGKVCNAQCLSAPDFREIMAAHNVGKPLADQIRWVEPKHVLAAARCDACKSPNGTYWPLVRTYLLCVFKSGGRSVQEQKFVNGALRQSAGTRSDPGFAPDLSYRAPMELNERLDHAGARPNGNGEKIGKRAGKPYNELSHGDKTARGIARSKRRKKQDALRQNPRPDTYNRVDEFDLQMAEGRRLARGDED